jgi:mono/diheme cytochrome c family protein
VLRKIIAGLVVAGVLAAAAFWLLTIPARVPQSALGPHAPDLANGRTMFLAGGCASCHALPNQQDRTRLGGGLALETNFGTFYVPNISPDAKDGIGAWNEAAFISAMTEGTAPGGEHLYPAFPYTSFTHMTWSDLRDLLGYLKTLPPVAGKVRDNALAFPFNIRRGLGLWKLLFLDDAPFKPDPSQSAQWNRGAYLVNGPGHCAECHSPRNIFGAIVAGQRFHGGPSPTLQGGIPDITQAKLHDWSVADIAETLHTGDTPDSDPVGTPMNEVVANTAQLSAADRTAMAVFIKSLPAK